MKKIILTVLVFGIFAMPPASCFAQDTQEMEDEGPQGGGPEGGMKHKKMNPMMGMMNKPSMIATSDGGVIVLEGPRLMKYDKDLTLVKEVELKKPKPGKEPQRPGSGEEIAGEQQQN